MYWVKKPYYKQAFSNVIVGCGEGKCSTVPMTRSQSFSDPIPLDCGLHMCYSVFFSFGGKGWLEWTGVFPFLQT